MAERPNQTIKLRDGRTLGYAEYGDLSGRPVFLFSGASSRLFHPPDDSIAASLHIRLIVAERPGFGLSDPLPNRTLLDWPDEVCQLADALGLKRFAVLGGSQGGPYALACGYKLAERLTTVTLVSSIAPFQVPGLNADNSPLLKLLPALANRAPVLLSLMMGMTAQMAKRNPERLVTSSFSSLPQSDQAILRKPEIFAMLVKDMPEMTRQGGVGMVSDIRAIAQPWGFPLEAVNVKVYLWQGEADPNATPAMGRYLASHLPNCQPTYVPGAGHFLAFTHWRDILSQLAMNQEQP
jgi:pimeloyl-ACP methyl ester carboxylesterase